LIALLIFSVNRKWTGLIIRFHKGQMTCGRGTRKSYISVSDSHSLSRVVVPAKLHHTSVNAWKIVPKSHDHHYRFQSHDKNIIVLVDGMFHSILHFVYHVIVFNFYLRKIVLQRSGGKSFLRENWFEMSDLFSSLLIFTPIKTILSTFFYCF
jgi:hypothetical protein